MAKRPVEWQGQVFAQKNFPTTAGQNNFFVVVDADESGPNPFSFQHYTRPTIVRIVGALTAQLSADSTSIENRDFRYAIGIICCDENLPAQDLQSEYAHPWLWLGTGTLHRPMFGVPVYNGTTIVTSNSTGYGQPIIRHEIDIRAMRKVNRDCELRIVLAADDTVGASSPHLSGFLRCLVKE